VTLELDVAPGATYSDVELYGRPRAKLVRKSVARSDQPGLACGHILMTKISTKHVKGQQMDVVYLPVSPLWTTLLFTFGVAGRANLRSPTGGAA
jgi:hypothetical protein